MPPEAKQHRPGKERRTRRVLAAEIEQLKEDLQRTREKRDWLKTALRNIAARSNYREKSWRTLFIAHCPGSEEEAEWRCKKEQGELWAPPLEGEEPPPPLPPAPVWPKKTSAEATGPASHRGGPVPSRLRTPIPKPLLPSARPSGVRTRRERAAPTRMRGAGSWRGRVLSRPRAAPPQEGEGGAPALPAPAAARQRPGAPAPSGAA
eukprot:TRINITY_DN19037_c1_g1_i1.p3 TRINITY_DN19037_c1_g1~~TRINITY_DN19037_c1_g1_i1.p3  ORF type:complete len:206 (+),score=25.39 TRINITY_DN19037_c1_g1_i1:90-707(+)